MLGGCWDTHEPGGIVVLENKHLTVFMQQVRASSLLRVSQWRKIILKDSQLMDLSKRS